MQIPPGIRINKAQPHFHIRINNKGRSRAFARVFGDISLIDRIRHTPIISIARYTQDIAIFILKGVEILPHRDRLKICTIDFRGLCDHRTMPTTPSPNFACVYSKYIQYNRPVGSIVFCDMPTH